MNKLLLLVDLGRLKAYRWEQGEQFEKPRLRFLEEWNTNVQNHLREEVTDQAGQYRKGSVAGGPSDLSDGEEHNLDLERRKRALRGIARHMDELIQKHDPQGCYLAAPAEINAALLEELPAPDRKRIEKNVSADLTKLDTQQILEHFSE